MGGFRPATVRLDDATPLENLFPVGNEMMDCTRNSETPLRPQSDQPRDPRSVSMYIPLATRARKYTFEPCVCVHIHIYIVHT